MSKDYTVFNTTMAHELIKMGFTYVGKAPSKNNPKYYVYFFQQEEGLTDAINKLAQKRRK